jgi:hypothetical protein
MMAKNMNIELTISGLCVIVFKSKQDRPPQPEAVEILCVDAPGHRPRLSYFPDWVEAFESKSSPELVVDPRGGKLATLDLHGRVVTLQFGKRYRANCSVTWGTETQVPPKPAAEAWMNWVPAAQELGIQAIRLGKPDELPRGASARLLLPPGDLKARSVIQDPQGQHYLVWKFPAQPGVKRAVANDVVYRATGITNASFSWGAQQLSFDRDDATLQLALSADMVKVPSDYNAGTKELGHLASLYRLAVPRVKVQVPKLSGYQRTGHPICNSVHFVDKS